MVSSVQNQITQMQNSTAQSKMLEQLANGPTQELGQDAFLMLMLEQLKHQDPTKPMSNEEFLAQQAQFTQVNELQKMNGSIAANNQIMQASSLIGKEVVLTNPDDVSKEIKGMVTSANFSGEMATITVNGKEYPLGIIKSINAEPTTTAVTPEPDETEEA